VLLRFVDKVWTVVGYEDASISSAVETIKCVK